MATETPIWKRPCPSELVTPSVQRSSVRPRVTDSNKLFSLDAIHNANNVPASPVQLETAAPSPLRNIATKEQCQETIRLGFHRKTANFLLALKALRILHHGSADPISVDNDNKKLWLYPCTSTNEECIGFLERTRKIALGTPQLCDMCFAQYRKEYKNDNKKDNNDQSGSNRRMSPVTTMKPTEIKIAYKTLQVKNKRAGQSIKRLKEQLKKCRMVPIKNVTDAVSAVKDAYTFLSSNKSKASKIIVDAIMDMEIGNRIPAWKQAERGRYADFIVSDIVNACHMFRGEKHKIRIHPIMANFAMNLYMGMRYEDAVDMGPLMFPTVRTIRRNRAKVATHDGTDPKVYARVSEMEGFKTSGDILIHWMFDEVKLTSGLMWNAKNDDLRGLCCGTTGSAEDLKEMLEDLILDDTTTNDNKEADGIYCNQWLARNPFGATLVGEFFYNQGNLDGNEIMRQFLQVSTCAAIANLETVGLVSDMGGANERFYNYLMDGRTIRPDNLWPSELDILKSPINPHVTLHTWSCSTHGAKSIRSQLEKSRSDGSGT